MVRRERLDVADEGLGQATAQIRVQQPEVGLRASNDRIRSIRGRGVDCAFTNCTSYFFHNSRVLKRGNTLSRGFPFFFFDETR